MEQRVRNAIARIDVIQNGQSISRGTGTLIGQRIVLTALHVVADRQKDPPVPHQGEITLTFPGGQTSAVIGRFHDRKADWVLLECATPPTAEPLKLDSVSSDDLSWETFGFPDANPRDGMVQSGTIEAIHAELDGMPVHQLFSKQAAAGNGAPVKGFSGAPVMVGDRIVGVLRFALMKDNNTVAGTLYACPSASVSMRRTAAIKLDKRPTWTWWPIAALMLPLAAGAVLNYLPVGSADVSLDLIAGRVGMVLADAQPLLSSPPRLDTVRVLDLREALVPPELEPSGVLTEPRLDIFAATRGATKGSLAMDVVPFPAGTDITLTHSGSTNEFAFSFNSALPDLRLSIDGPIGISIPGILDTSGVVKLERITLRPDSSHSELYLTLPRSDSILAFSPLTVRSLDFARVDRIREGDQARDEVVSTIHAGRMRFPGLGGGDTLTDAAPLAFHGSAGTLRIIGPAPDGVHLAFEGTVHGIRSGPREMPSQLQWLLGRHLAVVLGILGAYLIVVTTFILRSRRKRTLRALIGMAVALGCWPTPAAAQVVPVPDIAKQLIVRLRTQAEVNDENGAGIVLGETRTDIVIATAAHVVRPNQRPGQQIELSFAFAPGVVLHPVVANFDDDLDLAVLLIPKDSIPGYHPGLFDWDRRGNLRTLRNGDPLFPLGCPDGVCWEGQSPDPLIGVRGRHLVFESILVSPGSSGGGVFNQHWELVGLVLQRKDAQGDALTIDRVIEQVEAWGHPVALYRKAIPRGGYRLTMGASILGAVGGASSRFPDDRFPSGRLVLSKQTRSAFTYHVSGLRLAPDQLNINALMGGASLTIRYGRFSLLPFAEVGMGRVEGRFDAGGYSVADPNAPGGNRHVPLWRQSKEDGIGFGAGGALQTVLFPHIILEGTVAHWSFNIPDGLPKLQTLFVGAGVRFGL